jgi:hypothetical protein
MRVEGSVVERWMGGLNWSFSALEDSRFAFGCESRAIREAGQEDFDCDAKREEIKRRGLLDEVGCVTEGREE